MPLRSWLREPLLSACRRQYVIKMQKRIRKLFLDYIPMVIKTGILSNAPVLYGPLEIRPTSCNIMVTNRCNLRCVMCRQWREKPSDELTTEQWKRVIADLKVNGIKNIHFTGGEPLLREDLAELISCSSRNGFVVGLTTNGLLLKKDLLERLVDNGLRSIAISIDALNDKYEKIRGAADSFDRIEGSASDIAAAKSKRKIDAYINFTLMRENIEEFENVKQFADRLHLPVAICLLDKNSCIFDVEGNKQDFWISESKDVARLQNLLHFLRKEKARNPRSLLMNFPMIEFIGRYFDDPRQSHIPCVSSQDRIYIDPYGNLLSGCLSMGVFGNVMEAPFGMLRREGKYKIAKKSMFYKECAGCSCGYQFNIKNLPGMIFKDFLQRIRALKDLKKRPLSE